MASSSKKRIPKAIMELLDLAVFSFGSQSGLNAKHKVRGDPVIEGVCSFFGELLSCAKDETKKNFEEITEERLGGWSPKSLPTKELSTLVASRLKTLKAKGTIREAGLDVPDIVEEVTRTFEENSERVRTKRRPRCWRCATRCRFCEKKKAFPVNCCRSDLSAVFLDVMDEVIGDSTSDEDDSSDVEAAGGITDENEASELYDQLLKADYGHLDSSCDEDGQDNNSASDTSDKDSDD